MPNNLSASFAVPQNKYFHKKAKYLLQSTSFLISGKNNLKDSLQRPIQKQFAKYKSIFTNRYPNQS